VSDQERAVALLERWHAAPLDAGNLADWVAREFEAVRLEERKACIAVVEDLRSAYRSAPIRTILHVLAERLRLRS
jgi:hypothetical protein